MVDISLFPKSSLAEVAEYIKNDTLALVNQNELPFQPKDTFYTRYGKRLIDILISGAALIVTAPINLVIAIVTFFDVGRPLIFKQTRIGKDQKKFTIYKFRNMTNATDANGELLPPNQRVTKWGKFVRKTSLDELLNFVSIFKGDMSFIGPRPLLDSYAARLHNRHLMLYSVKPGLECPFHEKLDHAPTWQDRLDNYVWYAQNVSFMVDVKLLFGIFGMVFSKKSTAIRGAAKTGGFMGYDADGNAINSMAVPEKYVELFLKNHHYNTVQDVLAVQDVDNRVRPDASIKAQG